jgi:hypothetical protein
MAKTAFALLGNTLATGSEEPVVIEYLKSHRAASGCWN